jgi:hypothetical protein
VDTGIEVYGADTSHVPVWAMGNSAGYLTGAAADTLIGISENKTIHNTLRFSTGSCYLLLQSTYTIYGFNT